MGEAASMFWDGLMASMREDPATTAAVAGGTAGAVKTGVDATATGSTNAKPGTTQPNAPQGTPATKPAGGVPTPGTTSATKAGVDPSTGLPNVSMGKGTPTPGTTSANGQFSQAGQDIGRGLGKARDVATSDIGKQVGLSGASYLASKQLAGDTSPSSPPVMPTSYDTGDAAAKAAERERKRRAGQGRASTQLTGPLGLTKPASVGAKVLLGA